MSDLLTRIGAIRDPLLGRPLADLGMVGGVEERRLGAPRVTILVPVPQHQGVPFFEASIGEIAPGAKVEFQLMTDEERSSTPPTSPDRKARGLVIPRGCSSSS